MAVCCLGLSTEGVFRKSASLKVLQDIKQIYNQDGIVDYDANGGVHTACCVLKMWFRELPDPIFPSSIYSSLSEIESNTTSLMPFLLRKKSLKTKWS